MTSRRMNEGTQQSASAVRSSPPTGPSDVQHGPVLYAAALSIEDWQMIGAALAQQPYAKVALLIGNIQQQISAVEKSSG
jgi:hypothetical protein